MGNVKYGNNDLNAGAIPRDTNIRTENSTEAGQTSAVIQHVKLDTGDGTNTQPVSGTVIARSYGEAIVSGDVSGKASWEKIGFTPTMTTAESVVWSKAGVYTYSAAGIRMSVVSSSSDDSAAGTGARKVTIGYLDSNYAEQTEEVTLNEKTLVETVATDILRINSFRVTAAGTGAKPAGNVTLSSTDGAAVYSYITLGYTRARNSVYCVPAGKTLYIQSVAFGYACAANQVNYGRIYLRATQNNGVKVAGIFYPFSEILCANNTIYAHLPDPIKLVEKVDLYVGGIATASGVATSVLRGWTE